MLNWSHAAFTRLTGNYINLSLDFLLGYHEICGGDAGVTGNTHTHVSRAAVCMRRLKRRAYYYYYFLNLYRVDKSMTHPDDMTADSNCGMKARGGTRPSGPRGLDVKTTGTSDAGCTLDEFTPPNLGGRGLIHGVAAWLQICPNAPQVCGVSRIVLFLLNEWEARMCFILITAYTLRPCIKGCNVAPPSPH